jgi:hypothetical protein
VQSEPEISDLPSFGKRFRTNLTSTNSSSNLKIPDKLRDLLAQHTATQQSSNRILQFRGIWRQQQSFKPHLERKDKLAALLVTKSLQLEQAKKQAEAYREPIGKLL